MMAMQELMFATDCSLSWGGFGFNMTGGQSPRKNERHAHIARCL